MTDEPVPVPSRPSRAHAWLLAIRPATLPAAVGPVAVGLGVSVGMGVFEPLPALACLAVALLLQIASNVGNIAVGLRMLPTRAGYAPFLLVFKQSPQWGGWGDHAGIGWPDLEAYVPDKALIAQQLQWWEAVL